MHDSAPVIVWFRQDLRLADNPALSAAARLRVPVLPVYVLDDVSPGEWRMGAASRWWLHKSLAALDADLRGKLVLLRGNARALIPELARQVQAQAVYWNRQYEPWAIDRDTGIKQELLHASCTVRSFNGALLFDPPSTNKADGTPYRVFTPFYRKGCLAGGIRPRRPLARPEGLQLCDYDEALALSKLGLLPAIDWYQEMECVWTPGEAGALERLDRFLSQGLDNYDEGRDRPDKAFVSRLSPHLHFGELSPNRAWYAVDDSGTGENLPGNADRYLNQLGWREFSHNLLYNEPDLPTDNLQRKFDRFPWRDDADLLKRWQKGTTGYPIVDAGMRELWRTGYMHNRVRMIVGSFLVKNLMLHWHHGERWFWDTLVDADLANNSASWQWIAGCGADAAPYFRIFNPVTQGKKFDPEGVYVRQYVPELGNLPGALIHEPWTATSAQLHDAGIVLGDTYPEPIVDLKASRERALAAFRALTPVAK